MATFDELDGPEVFSHFLLFGDENGSFTASILDTDRLPAPTGRGTGSLLYQAFYHVKTAMEAAGYTVTALTNEQLEWANGATAYIVYYEGQVLIRTRSKQSGKNCESEADYMARINGLNAQICMYFDSEHLNLTSRYCMTSWDAVGISIVNCNT